MDRSQLIARLRVLEPTLRDHNVAALYLFGSWARDQAGQGSDVDVFVDKQPGAPFGFDELMGSYRAIEDALPGLQIGFGTRAGLSKHVRDDVERQAIRIF